MQARCDSCYQDLNCTESEDGNGKYLYVVSCQDCTNAAILADRIKTKQLISDQIKELFGL